MTAPTRRRALLVGVTDYQNFPGLPSVAVDLAVMAEVLGDSAVGGFDVIERVPDPDAATLRQRVADFLERSESDELAVVYISGHGLRSAATGEFHVVARDTDHSDLPQTAIPAGYLNEHLENCLARQKVLILDCCESGGFTAGFTTIRTPKSSEPAGAPIQTKGVYILSSSQAREASWVGGDDDSPSLFTDTIVEALRSGAGDRDRDGRVGVAELYEHVSAVLKARPKETRQTPVSSSIGVSGGGIYLAKAPVRRTDPRGGKAKAGRSELSEKGAQQAGGSIGWQPLLEYYSHCIRAENAEDKLLKFTPNEPGVVYVGGSEQLLSGAGADPAGTFPVPSEFADHIDEAQKKGSDLLYGYPVVVLLQDTQGTNLRVPQCAPLLIRRLEIVQGDDGSVLLHPYGEPEPNPVLSKYWLGEDGAENLLRNYSPTWGAGDHVGLAREINHLLRDEFELAWIDEIRPARMAGGLEANVPQSGARNTAVLVALDSGATVRKLLKDLKEVAEHESDIARTALGALLDGRANTSTANRVDHVVLGSLNDAQSDVLDAALTRRLTVATGPPGTGKSALIVNLVATAVAAGQSVLVASTNNTAVDEVWNRCERLVEGLIVRTGSRGNGESTNYQDAERDTLRRALASASTAPDRTLPTAQAAYSSATREYDLHRQAAADKAATEAALLAAGQQRAQALEAIRADDDGPDADGRIAGRLSEASDQELARLRARADKLHRARWFAARRHMRFLGRLGIGSTSQSAATLCLAVGAYADAEIAWRGLRTRIHSEDEGLTAALSAADAKRQSRALDLAASVAHHLRISGRTALQTLADHNASSGSDWGKLRTALPAAPAWAVTCLSARRFPPNPALFDLVIIDEASQCSIPAVLPVLFRAKRAVVIGDPLQLPHVATLKAPEEATIREKHGFGPQQLLEAHLAYRQDSAFHGLEHAAGGSLTLNEHYRCHPDIARLSDSLFYAPRGKPLTILTPTRNLRGIDGQPNVNWINQQGEAIRHHRGSWINESEINRVGRGIDYFLAKLPPQATIGVVTPFRAQASAIRARWADQDRVRVGTAHSFQGGECDVIIYSLVAADGISAGALRFLDEQANLWNVAITRARAHLFVISDRDFWIRRGGLGLRLLQQIEAGQQSPPWPHSGEYMNLLADRLAGSEGKVGLSEVRDGYVADAVVTARDGSETAIILDTGTAHGADPARHLLLQLKRTDLLASEEKSRHAQRIPAWRLYDE
ncbi:hypothetical protein ABH926_003757 [Catenulispora sp. GP43]|uniref:caspase, EACC1-associated type n=1 Tax=Catenulispora sp. GP43 TaxID=3156263 RepID=UPI0035177F46